MKDQKCLAGLVPDTPVESAGIYCCEVCGYEIVVRRSECLPREQSCAEHGMAESSMRSGEVRWQLVVAVPELPHS